MKHVIVILIYVMGAATAHAGIGFDNLQLVYENTELSDSDESFRTLSVKGEYSPASPVAVALEYSRNRDDNGFEQRIASARGFLYFGDSDHTIALGGGWFVTEIEAGNLKVDEDGTIVTLESRHALSEKVGLILGVDRTTLFDDHTDTYRGDLLISDGESNVDLVFSYQISDLPNTSRDAYTCGIGIRCNF